VKHEWINARAELHDDKWNLVSHQTRNEMHVAAQPIELCDGDGAFLAAGLFQCGSELRPAVESAPFPVSTSVKVAVIVKPLAVANRPSASCCAGSPSPDLACFCVLTR
jgi:hypothetical protein